MCKLTFKFVPINFQKRPCLEDSPWHTENASNMETENRLLGCTQPTILANQLHDYNRPLLDHNSAAYNGHMDINCNIVYRVNSCQEMDISYDSPMTRNQGGHHQLNLLVSDFIINLINTSCFLIGRHGDMMVECSGLWVQALAGVSAL